MTTKTRLARLEGTLSPKEATLAWLADAHYFPTLAAYVGWLVGQPAEAAPFWRVPEQAERAVRAAMRGEARSTIEAAAHQAVRDAVFLVELVIRLNVDTAETVRVERLRYTALTWEARALAAEARGPAGDGVRSHRRAPDRWEAFRVAVSDWHADLDAVEAVRQLLERRYLNGRDALFPGQASVRASLAEAAARLATATDGLAVSPVRRPHHDHGPRDRDRAGATVTAGAAHVTDLVRETTRFLLGDPTGAAALHPWST